VPRIAAENGTFFIDSPIRELAIIAFV